MRTSDGSEEDDDRKKHNGGLSSYAMSVDATVAYVRTQLYKSEAEEDESRVKKLLSSLSSVSNSQAENMDPQAKSDKEAIATLNHALYTTVTKDKKVLKIVDFAKKEQAEARAQMGTEDTDFTSYSKIYDDKNPGNSAKTIIMAEKSDGTIYFQETGSQYTGYLFVDRKDEKGELLDDKPGSKDIVIYKNGEVIGFIPGTEGTTRLGQYDQFIEKAAAAQVKERAVKREAEYAVQDSVPDPSAIAEAVARAVMADNHKSPEQVASVRPEPIIATPERSVSSVVDERALVQPTAATAKAKADIGSEHAESRMVVRDQAMQAVLAREDMIAVVSPDNPRDIGLFNPKLGRGIRILLPQDVFKSFGGVDGTTDQSVLLKNLDKALNRFLTEGGNVEEEAARMGIKITPVGRLLEEASERRQPLALTEGYGQEPSAQAPLAERSEALTEISDQTPTEKLAEKHQARAEARAAEASAENARDLDRRKALTVQEVISAMVDGQVGNIYSSDGAVTLDLKISGRAALVAKVLGSIEGLGEDRNQIKIVEGSKIEVPASLADKLDTNKATLKGQFEQLSHTAEQIIEHTQAEFTKQKGYAWGYGLTSDPWKDTPPITHRVYDKCRAEGRISKLGGNDQVVKAAISDYLGAALAMRPDILARLADKPNLREEFSGILAANLKAAKVDDSRDLTTELAITKAINQAVSDTDTTLARREQDRLAAQRLQIVRVNAHEVFEASGLTNHSSDISSDKQAIIIRLSDKDKEHSRVLEGILPKVDGITFDHAQGIVSVPVEQIEALSSGKADLVGKFSAKLAEVTEREKLATELGAREEAREAEQRKAAAKKEDLKDSISSETQFRTMQYAIESAMQGNDINYQISRKDSELEVQFTGHHAHEAAEAMQEALTVVHKDASRIPEQTAVTIPINQETAEAVKGDRESIKVLFASTLKDAMRVKVLEAVKDINNAGAHQGKITGGTIDNSDIQINFESQNTAQLYRQIILQRLHGAEYNRINGNLNINGAQVTITPRSDIAQHLDQSKAAIGQKFQQAEQARLDAIAQQEQEKAASSKVINVKAREEEQPNKFQPRASKPQEEIPAPSPKPTQDRTDFDIKPKDADVSEIIGKQPQPVTGQSPQVVANTDMNQKENIAAEPIPTVTAEVTKPPVKQAFAEAAQPEADSEREKLTAKKDKEVDVDSLLFGSDDNSSPVSPKAKVKHVTPPGLFGDENTAPDTSWATKTPHSAAKIDRQTSAREPAENILDKIKVADIAPESAVSAKPRPVVEPRQEKQAVRSEGPESPSLASKIADGVASLFSRKQRTPKPEAMEMTDLTVREDAQHTSAKPLSERDDGDETARRQHGRSKAQNIQDSLTADRDRRETESQERSDKHKQINKGKAENPENHHPSESVNFKGKSVHATIQNIEGRLSSTPSPSTTPPKPHSHGRDSGHGGR